MASTRADQYRRWFEYEKDSHRKVLASLAAAPAQSRVLAPFQKATALLGHIVAARWLWLFRFNVAPQGPAGIFPSNVTLDALTRQLGEMESAWDAYLAGLDDAELDRQFTYRSLEGDWFSNRVEDVLAQLFGHSWYHRGQIAALLRSMDCEPAVTDFIFWTREATTDPGRGT